MRTRYTPFCMTETAERRARFSRPKVVGEVEREHRVNRHWARVGMPSYGLTTEEVRRNVVRLLRENSVTVGSMARFRTPDGRPIYAS